MKRIQAYIPLLIVMACIIALWVYRWDSLVLPYFWDEMGVYGKGVQFLLEHGMGLGPKSLPSEISRGHPLLFYNLHATVIKLFGNSFLVSHSFSLIIASATLISTYLLAKEILPKLVAAACIVLLVSQNIFLAQSGLVIPEMLIALLSTLSLWSFFKRKYWLSIILLCLGILIKESVILIAAFIGIVYLIESIRSKQFTQNLKQLFLFTLPLFFLLGFLQIQHMQHGWYFFPYHTEIIQEGAFVGFWEKLNTHFKFIFFKQGRNQWIIAGLLAIISLPFLKNRRQPILLLTFFLVNLTVFSLAFYMDRYLLYLYPVLVVLVAHGVYFVCQQNQSLSFLALYILAALSFIQLNDTSFRYDSSLAYEDVVFVHQTAVKDLCALESGNFSCSSNFPINMSLDQAELGYIDKVCAERLSSQALETNADYIIMYNANPPAGKYISLGLYEKGEAQIELLQRDD